MSFHSIIEVKGGQFHVITGFGDFRTGRFVPTHVDTDTYDTLDAALLGAFPNYADGGYPIAYHAEIDNGLVTFCGSCMRAIYQDAGHSDHEAVVSAQFYGEIVEERYEQCEQCYAFMGDDEAVEDACLSSSKVREIAASWAGGGDALQALASTGAILPHVVRLIDDNLATCTMLEWEIELRQLRAYCQDMGERGPVAGWSDIRF